jgi:hypothetical protein
MAKGWKHEEDIKLTIPEFAFTLEFKNLKLEMRNLIIA